MADPVHPTIAAALRAQGRGSKSRLARAVGVQPQTVTKWVSGETSPPPERWLAIEDALELPRFTLAKAAGIYDALALGSVAEEIAVARWVATYRPTRRRGAALAAQLSTRLRTRVAEAVPELAALPAGTAERVTAYEQLGTLTDGVAEALAEVIDGPVLDRATATVAERLREALASGRPVATANYDEAIEAMAAAGDFALAAERGDISQLDDPSDPRGSSDRPLPPPVDADSSA